MSRVISLKSKPKVWSLSDFNENRNKILFYRSLGGLGDILMHRMIFEDFKKINPETEIYFACPPRYHDALIDHPYLDGVLDYQKVALTDYLMWFNTSACCGRYESSVAPYSDKHRSDIWAEFSGVKLTTHEMHIKMTEKELQFGKDIIKKVRNKSGPSIAICPISAMNSKNLTNQMLNDIINEPLLKDYFLFGLNAVPIDIFTQSNVPTIHSVATREWMSVLSNVDYVISVDTAAFHFAGGIKKPLTGIFSWADGKIYGMYYPTANIVQLHRDTHPHWTCGPCYNFGSCPKTAAPVKPCLTEITHEMIMTQVNKMLANHLI
jgi:ADP-heptose:LPS heptosyltransferase